MKRIILCLTCILLLASCTLQRECKVMIANNSDSSVDVYISKTGSPKTISANSSEELKLPYVIGRATIYVCGIYFDSKDVSIDVGLFGSNTTYDLEPDYSYVPIKNARNYVVTDVSLNGYEAVYSSYTDSTGNSIIQMGDTKYVKVPRNACNTVGSITYKCNSKTYKIGSIYIPEAGTTSSTNSLTKTDSEVL